MHKAFIHGVRTSEQAGILCNFDDALRMLAVTLACQQSAEQGRPVLLSELL